jgi:hypothetical protein
MSWLVIVVIYAAASLFYRGLPGGMYEGRRGVLKVTVQCAQLGIPNNDNNNNNMYAQAGKTE